MFCTNCGTQAHDGDLFCPGCGSRLKHAAPTASAGQQHTYSSEPQSRPASQYAQPQSRPGNPFVQEEPKKNRAAAKTKGSRSMGVIVAMLILVVTAMLLFVGARGYMGDDLSDMLSSCGSCSENEPSVENEDSFFGADTASDTDADVTSAADVVTTTTTTATTTTTTTTAPTTTTTTVDPLKEEAEEIRELLVSRKWQTELEGYKATVTFKKNGTATITVKVLFISKSIDAKYSVNDKCHAVIQADYEGQTLGISGQISKVSDTKLVVERDKNMGKVTLTAA